MIRKLSFIFLVSFSISLEAQNKIDFFILVGQSNAQGWMGDAQEYPKDEQHLDEAILFHWTFYGKHSSNGEWVTMQAQSGRFESGHFGTEVSFARDLKKEGYTPLIFKFCLGATGLSRDWKSPGGGGIYDAMVKDLKVAIYNLEKKGYSLNFRGFVWIQGESDAGNDQTTSDYQANLELLITDLRMEVLRDANLKVILGVDEQHSFVNKRPLVIKAQKQIAQNDRNIIYTTMYGLPKADGTHLTPAGLIEHGYRIFNAFKVLQNTDEPRPSKITLADQWEFVGVAVEEPGYTIWGSSPIIGEDGKVHLFVARWPGTTVAPGWRSNSEIAHYTSNSPEGPFTFSDIALKGTGLDTWDSFGMHNPSIHKVGKKYVLLYIANNNPRVPDHPSSQKIGMATSNTPYGPWEKINRNGLLLDVPSNPDYWNYKATNGVNNPSLLQHPNGGFFLYFKSENTRMGLAIAENFKGLYVQVPFPVTQNNKAIEDGYAFMLDGEVCLLTTDNHGLIEKGGGILWKSKEGIHFDEMEQGFYPTSKYLGLEKLRNASNHYAGDIIKFERPQLLLLDKKPAYLYVASGHNWFGGEAPITYIFKNMSF
ncbi:MAG: hypothetical protein ACJAUQ_000079 [Maribacter sp.]|jgi:hypothetical protein